MSRPTLTDDLAKYVLPPVHFDGLSLQAVDPPTIARFWGVVLNAPVRDVGGGHFRLDPGPQRPRNEIVRVRPVSRPATQQSRVHLDVRLPGAGVDHILAAGGQLRREPGADPWYVLADPEGNEFCAFPAVDDRPPGIFELVVKCRDARAQARWWSEVLGGEVQLEGEAAVVRSAPDFPWDFFVFDPVPEDRDGANRLHWHVVLRDRDPDDLLAMGAGVVRAPGNESGHWVLSDPEGNEFCAVPPGS
jgi:hypothetical protein